MKNETVAAVLAEACGRNKTHLREASVSHGEVAEQMTICEVITEVLMS